MDYVSVHSLSFLADKAITQAHSEPPVSMIAAAPLSDFYQKVHRVYGTLANPCLGGWLWVPQKLNTVLRTFVHSGTVLPLLRPAPYGAGLRKGKHFFVSLLKLRAVPSYVSTDILEARTFRYNNPRTSPLKCLLYLPSTN